MIIRRVAAALQSGLDRWCAVFGWLALPVSLLLFVQWPLRQFSGGHPEIANDTAQTLFALYVAAALRHTMRRGGHLRAAGLVPRLSPTVQAWARRLQAIAVAAVLLPWSAGLIALGAPIIGQSLAQRERFADTLDPGYCLIKLAMGLLLALVGIQALLDLASPEPAAGPPREAGP